MLEGVVKFPPEFAQKYREKGYWEDRTIASHFAGWFADYADRTAIIDGDKVTIDNAVFDSVAQKASLDFDQVIESILLPAD